MIFHQYAYHLHVLSRAVAYPNLSTAAMHVKLSQPQLSRIIAALEEELSVKILDRNAKRKSAWTPIAHKLAETHAKSVQQLQAELAGIATEATPKHVKVAALDGLMSIACRFVEHLFDHCNVRDVEIDLRDLSTIEEEFLRGNYDFMFSMREPGVKKFPYLMDLGYQSWDQVTTNGDIGVLSTFDYHHDRDYVGEKKHYLISNSLLVRRYWIQNRGGEGRFPSELKKKARDVETGPVDPVVLIGQETLPLKFWQQAAESFAKSVQ